MTDASGGEPVLERRAAGLLRDRELTVATAESCTAGLVVWRLSCVPGASDYLRGGMVAYHLDVKTEVLGVASDTLERHGPVSTETAMEMAGQAARTFNADVGVAVTGVAGPDPHGGREVGAVIVGVARRDDTGRGGVVDAFEFQLTGDRTAIQTGAATAALRALSGTLEED